MSIFNNNFSSETNQVQSMTNDIELRVNKIDFDTSCPCQVTACDGGTIKFCAPVSFDPPLMPPDWHPGTCADPLPKIVLTELVFGGVPADGCQIKSCNIADPIKFCSPVVFEEGFTFTGNICDDDGGATFKDFTALDGYYLDLATATCATGATAEKFMCIGKWTEGTTGPMSAVFQNYKSGAGGGAYIGINSVDAQPITNPGNNGLVISGGSLANTKNINIGAASGELYMFSDENAHLISTSANVYARSETGDVYIQSIISGINLISAGNTAITAGTVHVPANVTMTSTGDNITTARAISSTSNSQSHVLNSPGHIPQYSWRVDNNNAFVMQPINSATGQMSFFPQGSAPNPMIADLGQNGKPFSSLYIEKILFAPGAVCQIESSPTLTTPINICSPISLNGSLCIDDELGCDKIVLKTGATEGLWFSDDPCATPAPTERKTLYESPTELTLETTGTRSLFLKSGVGGTTAMVSVNRTTILSSGEDVVLESQAHDIELTATSGYLIADTQNFQTTSAFHQINTVDYGCFANGGGYQTDSKTMEHIYRDPASTGSQFSKLRISNFGSYNGPFMNFTYGSSPYPNVGGWINGASLLNCTTINGAAAPCDRRVKDNIEKIDENMKLERYNKLKEIDVVSYDYNIKEVLEMNRHIDTGFTTQQLTSIGLDDCVINQADDAPQVPNTNAMIGLLINAVQVLQEKVKQLEI